MEEQQKAHYRNTTLLAVAQQQSFTFPFQNKPGHHSDKVHEIEHHRKEIVVNVKDMQRKAEVLLPQTMPGKRDYVFQIRRLIFLSYY